MHRFALLLVAVLVLAGCGPSQQQIEAAIAQTQVAAAATAEADACKPVALEVYGTAMLEQIKLYANQADLVGSTPRVSMSVPLQRLLDIQLEAEQLTPPPCITDLHARIIDTC